MTHYRHIPKLDAESCRFDAIRGTCGQIQMLRPDDLLVDSRYQREIGPDGNRKIKHIAEHFDWGKFAPLLVVQLEGSSVYAIIDGQHRAAAAASRGDIELVPCFVLRLELKGQAETFLAINNEATRVTTGALWFARAAAGDREAIETIECAKAAGVIILRSPQAGLYKRPSHTSAPVAIADSIKRNGYEITRITLETLRKAGEITARSMITRVFIRALSGVIRHNPLWRDKPLHVLVSTLDTSEIEARARIEARDKGGSSVENAARIIHETIRKGLK